MNKDENNPEKLMLIIEKIYGMNLMDGEVNLMMEN